MISQTKTYLSLPTIQLRLNLIQNELILLASIENSDFRLRKYEMIKSSFQDIKSKIYPEKFTMSEREPIIDFLANIEIYMKTIEPEFIILKIEEDEFRELQTIRGFDIRGCTDPNGSAQAKACTKKL